MSNECLSSEELRTINGLPSGGLFLPPPLRKTLYTYAHFVVAGRSAQRPLQIDNRAHADADLLALAIVAAHRRAAALKRAL